MQLGHGGYAIFLSSNRSIARIIRAKLNQRDHINKKESFIQ